MDLKQIIALAENRIDGETPDLKTLRAIARFPEEKVFHLMAGADLLRAHFFGNTVHLCTICNAKSGRCSEDCRFCAQSAHYCTDAPVYPLLERRKLVEVGTRAADSPIHRYSIVTTGRSLATSEVKEVAAALSAVGKAGIETCASLGILTSQDFEILKAAGVGRYHHNLETAESHFDNTCTTHRYADRVATVRAAKAAGLTVCSGGIFGIGETDDQVLELALALRDLNVDAVPLNFLVAIPGTPFEKSVGLTPLRCLKIIALFRFVLPDKQILICGGREANLRELHPLVFYAGASGIMTGNYLTAAGRTVESDLVLLKQLGMVVKERCGSGLTTS
ncbi:MAG: biotin synthase BioB [Desulfobacterales bacterium]|jgi:biotin synthase|nr:biotin synthase BioB [Desulfobacterales bacterium]